MMNARSLTLLLIMVGCLPVWPAGAAAPIPVFVSIAPQRYFVQQIGKDLVAVEVLVEPGADPHTYEPKPQQMAALSKARLYFAIGIEFEAARLAKITALNPDLQVIHTDRDILKRPMAINDRQHGDGGDGDHAGRDPHIWLSPPQVMLQARSILTALQAADPDQRLAYEANYREFIMALVDLDAHLRSALDGFEGAAFMVVHPSWGTFAHTYGLEQIPIEIEGKGPKPAQLNRLIAQARSSRIKAVFVQPQFSSKSAQQIARAIDGRVVAIDPLAEAWASNLRQVAEEIQHAVR